MNEEKENIKELLTKANNTFQKEYDSKLKHHIHGQKPKIAILCCSDSRVIPELIFQQTIGDIFVVRVAGNVAVDQTVLTSLEYAVDHLKVPYLLILGHTHCGAIKATEQTTDMNNRLFAEIKQSFPLDENDHIKSNVLRQLTLIPKRSQIINKAIEQKQLTIIGGIYYLETGKVTFL